MGKIIFWLEQIFRAITSIASQNQSDWDENDDTRASFIKNKPAIPSAPTVTFIEGTVSEGIFTADAGQPTLAEAVALLEDGNFVYLKYADSDIFILEMAVAFDAETPSIATKNIEWSAPAAETPPETPPETPSETPTEP